MWQEPVKKRLRSVFGNKYFVEEDDLGGVEVTDKYGGWLLRIHKIDGHGYFMRSFWVDYNYDGVVGVSELLVEARRLMSARLMEMEPNLNPGYSN